MESRLILARANLFMTSELMIGRLGIRRLLLELGTVSDLKVLANTSLTDLEEFVFHG